ncbi:MAG: hypothetical protein BWX65_00533 [Bacteroidetes bacterium ADurb.Bin057]|nr:MAG: hypothetical protein BWX65_00533 [Bacteroidetes bacterium ADurb.Bin057]
MAVRFYSQSGLKRKYFGNIARCGVFKQFRRNDINHCGCFSLLGFVSVAGNNHLVDIGGRFFQYNIDFLSCVLYNFNWNFLAVVAYTRYLKNKFSDGQVFKEIVPRFVGSSAYRRAFKLYIDERQVFAGVFVHHISYKMGIAQLSFVSCLRCAVLLTSYSLLILCYDTVGCKNTADDYRNNAVKSNFFHDLLLFFLIVKHLEY